VRRDVSALIVAGGKASRMGGVDKRELVVEGQTIFARQCEVLAPHVAEIIVSAPRDVPGYRTVGDAVAGAGPLAGIAAGLAAATTPWLLVIAGDMPFVSSALIDLMLRATHDDIYAAGVRIGGLPEPLLCVLHAGARAAAEQRLATRRFKASGLLTDEALRVSWIEESTLRAIDPELRALFNVNRPDDLARE
jgi:molybdopterin-guanine dinucleotide biosynthesis protein A